MPLDVLDIDIGGNTDANGNLTLPQVPSPAYFCNLKVVAQVAGTPIWVVLLNQRAVTFGRGGRVDLGPILIQPRDTVAVQVIGAQASSALTGKLIGVTGSLAEVITNFSPAPNTIAMDTFQQSVLLATITCPVNTRLTNTAPLQLPANAQGIGYLVDFNPSNHLPNEVQIFGHQTQAPYILAQPTGPVGDAAQVSAATETSGATEIFSVDTAIDWVVNTSVTGTGPSVVYLFAYLNLPRMRVSTVPDDPLLVTDGGVGPAPWQAALSSATTRAAPGALNTDFTIISGVANTVIYLHACVVNNNTGNSWEVAFWDGPSVNGIKVADLAMLFATSVGSSPPINWDGDGRPLGKGNSLIGTIVTGAAGATVFGTYGYSQQ